MQDCLCREPKVVGTDNAQARIPRQCIQVAEDVETLGETMQGPGILHKSQAMNRKSVNPEVGAFETE